MIVTGGKTPAAGDIAAGAADSGNPVKVGGKYNNTLPTLADGQRGDIQLGARGSTRVEIYGASNQSGVYTNPNNTDGVGVQNGLLSLANAYAYNGTTWDRVRNNVAATGLASAARTVSTPTPDQTNWNSRGAQIILDVTATPNDVQTLQVTVEVKDPVSGKYVQIAAFTALVASALGAAPTTETYAYTMYPGAAETIAATKHELQALPLGRTWRVNVLHSAGGSWTYSVGITSF